MSIRTILLLVVAAITALFVTANWQAINQPQELSLFFTTFNGPLGLLMLGLMMLLALLLIISVVVSQTTLLSESRKSMKLIDEQRQLADKAEASRFTELKTYLEERLNTGQLEARSTRDELKLRMDTLEAGIARKIDAMR